MGKYDDYKFLEGYSLNIESTIKIFQHLLCDIASELNELNECQRYNMVTLNNINNGIKKLNESKNDELRNQILLEGSGGAKKIVDDPEDPKQEEPVLETNTINELEEESLPKKSEEFTYEEMIEAGWDDKQLLADERYKHLVPEPEKPIQNNGVFCRECKTHGVVYSQESRSMKCENCGHEMEQKTPVLDKLNEKKDEDENPLVPDSLDPNHNPFKIKPHKKEESPPDFITQPYEPPPVPKVTSDVPDFVKNFSSIVEEDG